MIRSKLEIAILCLATFAAPAFSQTIPTFSQKTSPTNTGGDSGDFAIDVNNDGVTDVVELGFTSTAQPTFNVELGNGDGTFKPAVTYTVPASHALAGPASGDFNGDGKIDLAFAEQSTGNLIVYLGNGDGTFGAPKTVNMALPSGYTVQGEDLIAADLNRDGKVDLVAEAVSSTGSALVALQGDGAGNFAGARALYTFAGTTPGFLLTGDFDGDAIADLAYSNTPASCTQQCRVTVNVLYGNGDFTFQNTAAFTDNLGVGALHWAAGDVNSDGKTDLFGIYDGNLHVLYGSASGTFAQSITYAPESNFFAVRPVLADFNGDEHMDIVLTAYSSSPGPVDLLFFLQTSSGGFATYKYSVPNAPGLLVGTFDKGNKPALATPSPTEVYEYTNTTPNGNWGGCAYPAVGEGFNVCSPTSSSPSPVRFNAAANSFGPLRKIEIWADGTKVGEQYHVWANYGWVDLWSGLPAGTRNVTFILVDTDNRLKKDSFATKVTGNPCPAPTSPGVSVCMPGNNATVSSPVEVVASASVNGTLARMEIWVDGVKKFTETTATYFETKVSLASGYHRFDVYGVNTAGAKYEKTVYATVQ